MDGQGTMETISINNRPEKIPSDILGIHKLSINSKRLWALLLECKGTAKDIQLSTAWLADRLALTRQAVSRAVGQLESMGFLSVFRPKHECSIYHVRQPKHQAKNFFLFFYRDVNCRYTVSEMMVLAYLKWRQGQNDAAWPHVSTIAAELGISKRQAIRAVKTLENGGLLAVRRAHGGIKQGNRYTLTASFDVKECYPKNESGVTNHDTDSNTFRNLKHKGRSLFNESGLSEPQQVAEQQPKAAADPERGAKVSLLCRAMVKLGLAQELAAEHTLDSIGAAIANAEFIRDLKIRQGKAFNQAAYVVGTLSRARQEGHTVKMNSHAQAAFEKFKAQKQAGGADFVRAVDAQIMAAVKAELETVRNQRFVSSGKYTGWIEQQKALLGVA